MHFMTAKEAASLLRVREARVYELVRLKMLPVVRMGRHVRFDRDELAKWAAAGGSPLSRQK
jgi:excisionase family DNA binding protein